MENNKSIFAKEVIKNWGKFADADSKKLFTNKELEKLVDFIVLKYQNNPDDKNFSGALIEYINNLVDGKSK